MRNTLLAFVVLTFAISYNVKAQDFDFISNNYVNYYFEPQNLGLSTPKTAEFTKYGNVNIDHYNGLLNFEIPVFDYKDINFEIPISIKYISEGFKPGKRPSIIGYNWVLNVGGLITREIKGSPDETMGQASDSFNKYMLKGYLAAIRSDDYKKYTKDDLWNLNIEKTGKGNPYSDIKCDLASDIYYFSFGKHSGRFIIDNDGTPISIDGGGYMINIEELAIQEYKLDAPKDSKISILTPDGYRYIFGGDITTLEYTIPNNLKQMKHRPRQIMHGI